MTTDAERDDAARLDRIVARTEAQWAATDDMILRAPDEDKADVRFVFELARNFLLLKSLVDFGIEIGMDDDYGALVWLKNRYYARRDATERGRDAEGDTGGTWHGLE